MGAHTDTRNRIQEVAIRLFTEQGYEATSLREIAEALGVTKAALYYHFRTKEDIVASLIEDRVKALDELIAWAGGHPHTPEIRGELIRRYSAQMTRGRHHEVMQFMDRNKTALQGHAKVDLMRERMGELMQALCEPDDPLPVRLRRSMALFAMHAAWFLIRDESTTEEERTAAGLQVALELAEGSGG
ncbi:TetR/AcrR family transcriptional regulator [Microbispora bryophytorum]|uniref:TetR family transcriptional regulator n=1 Tax=Microbispora bryophytorum TaxID=1460882 RepID=A0A8H9H0B4_9ACTN|nr:TetR/AcrR family transcriptional regulator [Microbispora bryophytorum]MBD3137076.1 TetR/AcrR family transcriptional regulator [Microbispora bryophytorum]TQS07323.1 TetR/AcrR family transcriptional regulator [Microbispora bryophytorum]GGO14349.1 TetR family transcriptional regulator [Microbispora bryophytorum]